MSSVNEIVAKSFILQHHTRPSVPYLPCGPGCYVFFGNGRAQWTRFPRGETKVAFPKILRRKAFAPSFCRIRPRVPLQKTLRTCRTPVQPLFQPRLFEWTLTRRKLAVRSH